MNENDFITSFWTLLISINLRIKVGLVIIKARFGPGCLPPYRLGEVRSSVILCKKTVVCQGQVPVVCPGPDQIKLGKAV